MTATRLTLAAAQVGQYVRLVVSYTDGRGTAESVSSAATDKVANVNDAPTGTVLITGSVSKGATLTASNSLSDLDGMGVVSYQWKADGVAISGATGSTYTLTASTPGLNDAIYKEVNLALGQERTINIIMQPVSVSTEITVSGGELAVIDTSSATVGTRTTMVPMRRPRPSSAWSSRASR